MYIRTTVTATRMKARLAVNGAKMFGKVGGWSCNGWFVFFFLSLYSSRVSADWGEQVALDSTEFRKTWFTQTWLLYIVYGVYMGDITQFEKARNMLRVVVDVGISNSLFYIHASDFHRHRVSWGFFNKTSPCRIRVRGYHAETRTIQRPYTDDGCRLSTQSQ